MLYFHELRISKKNQLYPIYMFLILFFVIYYLSCIMTAVNYRFSINDCKFFYSLDCFAITLNRTIITFIFYYINSDIVVFFQLIESNVHRMWNYSFKELVFENETLLYYIKRFSYTLLFNYLVIYIYNSYYYIIIDTPIIIFSMFDFIFFKKMITYSVIIIILDLFARKYNQNEEFRKHVKRFIYIFIINHFATVIWFYINNKNYNLSNFIVTLLYNSDNILVSMKFAIIAFICDFFIKRAKKWEY